MRGGMEGRLIPLGREGGSRGSMRDSAPVMEKYDGMESGAWREGRLLANLVGGN